MPDYPQHLRDHVARPLDQDPVSDLQSEAFDLVEVVQGRTRHSDSADSCRLQVRARRDRAGSPNLQIHVLDDRFGLLCQRLGGNCPARRLGGRAQLPLVLGRIDLEDQAVDLVFQRLPPVHPAIAEFAQAFKPLELLAMRIYLESQFLHQIQALPVRFTPGLAINQQRVSIEVQSTARGDRGVEHAQRAGGGIPRIGENMPALGGLAPVERRERGLGHHHFAAHFEAAVDP